MSYYYYTFIRQRNNYTCGPIALYNLLTWANAHTIMTYRNIYKLTNCDSKNGTTTLNFTIALKKLIHKSNGNMIVLNATQPQKTNKQKDFDDLHKLLFENSNLCAIVEYEQRATYLHFVLLFVENNKLFIINQEANKKSVPVVQKINNLNFMIKFNNKKHHPLIWIVQKK